MKYYTKVLALALLAAGLAPRVSAQPVDQQQLYTYARIGSEPAGTSGLAQSFVPTASDITGASVYTSFTVAVTANITISLWDALPNATGATELASAVAPAVPRNTWANVSWNPVTLTPGTTYYLAFSPSAYDGFAGTTTNSYPNGVAYAVDASNNPYVAFPNLDFAFKTFTQVPEPSALAVFGLGGAGLLLVARRRFCR
jgi:hypothetical protein